MSEKQELKGRLKMTLYQINKELEKILDMGDGEYINAETGELLYADDLTALELERDIKIDNTACYIKNLRYQAEMINAEKAALDKRMKAKNDEADKLAEHLKAMLAGEKYESARVAISYGKSTETIINDKDLIPAEYLRTPKQPAAEPDKTAIKKAIKSGRAVPGAELLDKTNIYIK